MVERIDRRTMLTLAGGAAAAAFVDPGVLFSRNVTHPDSHGAMAGEPHAALAGQQVIAEGGNAVDGLVAGALAAGVSALGLTGIAGYGGHMTVAMVGKPVRVIDFNSTAPAAARHDMFNAAADGSVPGRTNEVGWLAAGVPGTLAGLQMACDRFGTKSIRELLQPAIRLALDGFLLENTAQFRSALEDLRRDPATRELLLVDGEAPREGMLFRNPELAALLETLAADNSVEAFYKGGIARRIARAFAENGGLVDESDLAAYEAREVDPITLDWLGHVIHTAPLTAGGATMIETFRILRALDASGGALGSIHARLESLRIAWRDRLELFGDPEQADVPLDELLSDEYVEARASEVAGALERKKPLDVETLPRVQHGTVNLSVADDQGNMAAVTFTHGAWFGARVTVPGLGLLLGHGVSRFDPRAGHPNSPGPRKRPLHNMCPTIVTRDGRPVVAVGGAGGRRIPNAVFNTLTGILAGKSVSEAVAAPRIHTEGNRSVVVSSSTPDAEVAALRRIGYEVETGRVARVSAVGIDPKVSGFTVAEG